MKVLFGLMFATFTVVVTQLLFNPGCAAVFDVVLGPETGPLLEWMCKFGLHSTPFGWNWSVPLTPIQLL